MHNQEETINFDGISWRVLTYRTSSLALWKLAVDLEETSNLDPGMVISSHNKWNLHFSLRKRNRQVWPCFILDYLRHQIRFSEEGQRKAQENDIMYLKECFFTIKVNSVIIDFKQFKIVWLSIYCIFPRSTIPLTWFG